jgi:hypothetical protein
LPELASRHQLFEAARRRADWTIEQLWIDYLALGGTLLVFDLDAYLAGLMPLPPGQQDVLACALNERLTDLSDTTRLPYLTLLPDHCTADVAGLEGEEIKRRQGAAPGDPRLSSVYRSWKLLRVSLSAFPLR